MTSVDVLTDFTATHTDVIIPLTVSGFVTYRAYNADPSITQSPVIRYDLRPVYPASFAEVPLREYCATLRHFLQNWFAKSELRRHNELGRDVGDAFDRAKNGVFLLDYSETGNNRKRIISDLVEIVLFGASFLFH